MIVKRPKQLHTTVLLLNLIFVQMKVYFELIDISEYKCKVHIYS